MASIAAAIGGIGSLIGGAIGSSGASKAAATLNQAGINANNQIQGAVQPGQAGETAAVGTATNLVGNAATSANSTLASTLSNENTNLNPYLQAGQQGVTSLANTLAPGGSLATTFNAPNPNQVTSTPEYQFELQQGEQAIANSAAGRGLSESGATAKATDQYAAGTASTAYQQAYNNALTTYQTNFQNTLQPLTTLAGIGTTATGQFNAAQQNAGNLTSQNTTNAAANQAATTVSGAQFNANLGYQGAVSGANELVAGAGGQAAGQAGSAAALQQGLGGAFNAAGQYAYSTDPTSMANIFSSTSPYGYGGNPNSNPYLDNAPPASSTYNGPSQTPFPTRVLLSSYGG